ncbi:GDSL-type esterase/lipase family protein [Kitasatospora purpeofusca]|uniref:SGNH/GDSL hydrolase family protein n=1 Tax=Kitasatospora purpeofusca TaxID=67352 RepID=UPI0036C7DE96
MKITTARSVHHIVELRLTAQWMTNHQDCAGCRRVPHPALPRGSGRDGSGPPTGRLVGPLTGPAGRPLGGPVDGEPRPPALAARLHRWLVTSRPPADRTVPPADGRYGPAEPADPRPLTLLMLGDSLARGLGAGRPEETLGARLAQALGEHLDRPVDLRVLARVGATTAALRHQVARADRLRPGIAVLIVGGNDVLLPLPLGRAARRFALVLQRLRDTGWHPVVVPCPDPGHAPGLRAPARLLGTPRAHRLAHRQTRAAERAGVPVAVPAGPGFRDRAEHLLGPDGVHPSARGHAEHATRILPALITAAAALPAAPAPVPGAP